MQCSQCQNELRWVEAGVSKKTGKPYQGFWSECKNCGWKPNSKPQQPHTASYPQKTYNAPNQQFNSPQGNTEPNWNKISFGKCKHAFLVEAFKKDVPLENAERLAEAFAEASMRVLGKPEMSPVHECIDQVPFNDAIDNFQSPMPNVENIAF